MKVGDLVEYKCGTHTRPVWRNDELGIIVGFAAPTADYVRGTAMPADYVNVYFPFGADAGTIMVPPFKLKVLNRADKKTS